MIVDKPAWVSHGGYGNPIFSVDVHPHGTRVATAGSDHKVKIWNMLPVTDVQQELNAAVPKLLATLADHYAPVNVARFSRDGRHLATGSDDKLVCIYELRAGAGARAFGSSDQPSVENWKHTATLRGHLNNVLDVAWSHDDRWLASCSVDNQIIIWDGATGAKVKQLEGHTSYVKGVAWDPVGTYLASQGDDKTLIVWRTDDWSRVVTITEPFQRWVSLAFSLRLCWAPDGSAVVGVNSFQSPKHTAVMLHRGSWGQAGTRPPDLLVGHKAAVLVASFSPRMYKYRGQLVTCLALGSQDKQLTVWLGQQRPMYIGCRFFKNGVVDLAWAPDGLTLLAASTDGSVATLQFSADDLAPLASKKEVAAHMQRVYGDQRARTAIFAESADQLALEAAAAVDDAQAAGVPLPNGTATAAALDARLGPGGQEATLGRPSAAAAQPAAVQQPPRRIAPQLAGAATANGPASGPASHAQAATNGACAAQKRSQAAAPAGQGRPTKRVRPEPAEEAAAAAGPPSSRPPLPPPAQRQQQQQQSRPQQQQQQQLALPAPGSRNSASAATAAAAAAAAAAVSQPAAAPPQLPVPEPAALLSVHLGTEPSIIAGASAPRVLEVANRAGAGGRPSALISCSVGSRRQDLPKAHTGFHMMCNEAVHIMPWAPRIVLYNTSKKSVWQDEAPCHVAAAAGSLHFAAVALLDGTLQVYTAGGRRLLPPLQLGGRPAFLAAGGPWRLLAVAAGGEFRVWHLASLRAEVQGSAAPLLVLAPARVTGMRLSDAGLPLAVLSDGTAHAYHAGMAAWMRVADASFPSSAFHSILRAPSGELGQLQSEAAGNTAARRADMLASLAAPHAARGGQGAASRGHLEANMAAALALQSAADYRRWLLTYARFLSAEADEARLRELCGDLLGPPRAPGRAAAPEATAAEAESAAQPDRGAGGGAEGAAGRRQQEAAVGDWQPTVLGLDKRELLRKEVLRDIGRNRANQRLVNEITELLSRVA